MRLKCVAVLSAVCLLGIAGNAAAAPHILLSIEGIPGGFTAGPYANWIECAGFQHNVPGLPKPLALMSGTAPRQPAGSFTYDLGGKPFSLGRKWAGAFIVKEVDKSTPMLEAVCRTGRLLPSMKMELCDMQGGVPVRRVSLNFEEIKLCGYVVMAPGSGDRAAMGVKIPMDRPVEVLCFAPARVAWEWPESD